MQCPFCEGDSQVNDSRSTGDGQIRRRRICNQCKRRFTTYERVGAPGLKVIKRSGKTEDLSPDKILTCLQRVCRHRPVVSDDQMKRMVRSIEAQLIDANAKKVESSTIAALLLEKLREADRVSWNRLAANYTDENGQLRVGGALHTGEPDDQLPLLDSDSD